METVSTWLKQAHKNAGWLMVLGVVEIIAGIVALAAPLSSGLAITMVLGAAMVVGGIVRLFVAFGADSFGSGALAFIWGLIVAATGFYILSNPGVGLVTLALVIATLLFVSGLTEIIIAVHMKPLHGWGWMLTAGILTVILAVLLWMQFPEVSLWLVGTVLGIQLIAGGVTTVMVASAARKLTNVG